jgi:subtilase family serine protease
VTIPAATPPNTYFLLACADDPNAVTEINEDNNGIATATATVTVARPDLVETTATTNPPAPIRAPGTTFSVTDTARNLGPAPSGPSKTRYYLSLDAVKSAGDTLLTGSRAVPGLAAGGSHSGTVTVTIPAATALDTYFLLACADDPNDMVETDEGNNCIASATATVTVARPDLVENTVSAPPATKARGTSFPVMDTVQNLGTVASGPSTTRYYLSLDAVKSASDLLLTKARAVPGLAAGGSHSGTVTVTIPAATPLNTYFLLACADDLNTVVETNETNNCTPSSTTVTVTP